ncbi:MAG: cobalt transporter [Thermoproteus sp.]
MLKEFVEGLTKAVLAFERVRNPHPFLPYLFTAATVAAAFSPDRYMSLAFAAAGAIAAWRGRGLREWSVATAMSTVFASLVSLPALLGLISSKVDPALFISRAAGSAAVLVGGLLYCSWNGFFDAFKKLLPRDLVKLFGLLPPYIYTLGRTAIAVVAAREARTPDFDKKAYAAAIGDIIIYSIERGRALRMAYEARSP